MQKKSQAALEFLTVYGWSITILLLVILGFFYINVFNVQAPNTCNPGSPIICSDVKLDENGDLLLVLNSKLVKTAYIVKYELNAPIKTTCVPTNNIISDMNKEITCNVGTTLIKNQKYSGSATINYILSPSGSQHEVKLEFSGIVESANFNNENLVNYSDVLVVININSQVSEQVGSYFANARYIPSINIARISVSGNEEINDAEFNSLRSQLESHIINNNLQDKINYIVTTKGVPLKINRGDGCFSTSSSCASVDSELMLILGAYSVYIGQAGRITSPYYYWSTSFSHTTYGIYLVTRLDGYTFEQIKNMIDKAAQPIVVDAEAKFVFDQDPDWNSGLPSLNARMQTANDILVDRGYNSIVNTSTVYVTNQTKVIGYTSWGSNDHYDHLYTQNAKPNNEWQPGAIAETYVSSSARTFNYPPTYGQSLIADLIEEGITGAKGYVYEPFSSAISLVQVLFDRYTDNYNLAESFYMASRYASWMDVVIGDPKTSIKKQ